jgi:transcriptional regulator with XRE-family HTH domain
MEAFAGPSALVRRLRREAGLTQRELARRAGVSQPVIARLERSPTANPTVGTLAAIAAAVGVRLRVVLEPTAPPDPVVARYQQDVDRTLLRENLRRSVDHRIRSLAAWQADLARLQRATRDATRRPPRHAAGRPR